MALTGLYKAKATKLDGTVLTAFVPQVFGEAPVSIRDFIGTPPTTMQMGWVSFQGGNPEYPVWFGVQSMGSGLDQATADARYVDITGDTMTGALQINPYLGGSGLIIKRPSTETPFLEFQKQDDTRVAYIQAKGNAVDNEGLKLQTENVGGTGNIIFYPHAVERMRITPTEVRTTVPVTLPANPTAVLHAATKQYVDANAISQANADLRYVNVAGDTMTGSLVVNVAGNFHGLRLQNNNNTPFLEFRSNDATPTRYSYVQGSPTLTVMQADVGDVKIRALAGRAIMQSPVGADVELGNAADIRFRILNSGFEKASINNDGGATLYTSLISGGLNNHALTLEGLFAADLHFNASRFSGTGPAGNVRRGTLTVDGDENMILITENLAAGTGDILFRPKGVDSIRVVGSRLLVGKAATGYGTVKGAEIWGANGQIVSTMDSVSSNLFLSHINAADLTANDYVQFLRSQSVIGHIHQSGSAAVIYATSSHGPFKANVTDLDDDEAIERIKRWRPVSFQWKYDDEGFLSEKGEPSGEFQHGFIAQELNEVQPSAVSEGRGTWAEHEEWVERMKAHEAALRNLAEGEEAPETPGPDPFRSWMTDNSRLVPDLVAAVQALIHRVEQLE